MTEPDPATRDRLEQELARVRRERDELATRLGGEDPDDPDAGDRGDAANQLEGQDDLSRVDRRVAALERRLAGADGSATPSAAVTLRFPDGEVATYRLVALTEEAGADDQDEVVTVDSPLGRALAGCRAGDTLTWSGPDGDLRAEVVSLSGG